MEHAHGEHRPTTSKSQFSQLEEVPGLRCDYDMPANRIGHTACVLRSRTVLVVLLLVHLHRLVLEVLHMMLVLVLHLHVLLIGHEVLLLNLLCIVLRIHGRCGRLTVRS